MSRHFAMMVKRHDRNTASGAGVALKHCTSCYRPVLSAYRGEVTAVGKGEIQSVDQNGDIIGKCECGRRVVWGREVSRSP